MAFLGFSVCMFIGLWVDNPFETVVMRSLVVLVLFYLLGLALSAVGQKVVVEHFETESQAALGESEHGSTESQKEEESEASSTPVSEDIQSPQTKG